MLLCLVRLHQRRQYVEPINVGSAEHRVIDHQRGDFVERRSVFGFSAYRTDVHRDYLYSTVSASARSYSAWVPTNLKTTPVL